MSTMRSRREMIRLLGAGAAWWMTESLLPWSKGVSAQSDSCVVRPEQTEGPYFVDERLNRSDIRADPADGRIKPGTPLNFAVVISRTSAGSCQPLEGAQVDIWHCDALGVYSDVDDPGFNTLGRKFLRGYQLTDARGEARFLTIYPGWYRGRTVHIHIKVRTSPQAGRSYAFTSQMYFPDTLTDQVHAQPPYAGQGQRRARNEDDTIALKKVSCGTELTIVQEGLPDVIPLESCYLGWQESLALLAKLVEAEIPG